MGPSQAAGRTSGNHIDPQDWNIPRALASDIRRLPCPTKVIGADPAVPLSFLPSVDLSDMVALDYDFVPETTHFLQLEEPQECVDRTLEFLRREQLA